MKLLLEDFTGFIKLSLEDFTGFIKLHLQDFTGISKLLLEDFISFTKLHFEEFNGCMKLVSEYFIGYMKLGLEDDVLFRGLQWLYEVALAQGGNFIADWMLFAAIKNRGLCCKKKKCATLFLNEWPNLES